MAHIIEPPAPDQKKGRASVKDKDKDKSKDKEARREEMKEKLDEQRQHNQEADKAKRRLRIIATQKCKTEEEIKAALAHIAAMSPKEAIDALDLHLAKADASFVDRVTTQIQQGLGALVDWAVGAEGCVSQKFQEDSALHNSLVAEFGFAAGFLNNKMQIAVCCASDTAQGYHDAQAKKKLARRPPCDSKEEKKSCESKAKSQSAKTHVQPQKAES